MVRMRYKIIKRRIGSKNFQRLDRTIYNEIYCTTVIITGLSRTNELNVEF